MACMQVSRPAVKCCEYRQSLHDPGSIPLSDVGLAHANRKLLPNCCRSAGRTTEDCSSDSSQVRKALWLALLTNTLAGRFRACTAHLLTAGVIGNHQGQCGRWREPGGAA
jgi:hypothetical protein